MKGWGPKKIGMILGSCRDIPELPEKFKKKKKKKQKKVCVQFVAPKNLGLTKGWFPKGWFWRMFPRNENPERGYIRMQQNEGAFGCSPGTKTGTRAHSPKQPFYETALLSPSDRSLASSSGSEGLSSHCPRPCLLRSSSLPFLVCPVYFFRGRKPHMGVQKGGLAKTQPFWRFGRSQGKHHKPIL